MYENSRDGSPEIEIISPVGYKNYSSGSDIKDNQIKIFDNYYTAGLNNNKYIYNNIQKKRNINYEIEDSERFDYLGRNKW